jgi:hypothetical protein
MSKRRRLASLTQRPRPTRGELSRKQQHHHQIRDEHSFVIDGTAAVQNSVSHLAGERIDRPLRALDADDVHVCEQEHGAFVTGAASGSSLPGGLVVSN